MAPAPGCDDNSHMECLDSRDAGRRLAARLLPFAQDRLSVVISRCIDFESAVG